MAYIVTTNIIDTKDNNRLYEKGEVYPREDLNVTDARIKKGLSNQTGRKAILYCLTMNPLKRSKKKQENKHG